MTDTSFADRIAAAPISWGVSEVPGWGYQVGVETVLGDIATLGLAATEYGPAGFLPEDAEQCRAALAAHGLTAVGGFVPVVLHDAAHDPLPELEPFFERSAVTGANVLVLAAASGVDGYENRRELTDDEWTVLLGNLDRIVARATAAGVTATVHPHIGTLIETAEHVDRVVAGSSAGLCLDTGHLVAAGSDPAAVVAAHAHRVRHVHLKDVDAVLGPQVASGERGFADAITDGLFTVLGTGSVDVGGIISTLEDAGYDGWYVLEQDIKLAGEPAASSPLSDIEACLAFVRVALATTSRRG